MKLDLTNVNYSLLKAGDTLRITGKPHLDGNNEPLVQRGDTVMVETVHAAGVTTKTKADKKVSFYFEHGAEKLQYTEETKKAITARAEFAKADKSPAADAA